MGRQNKKTNAQRGRIGAKNKIRTRQTNFDKELASSTSSSQNNDVEFDPSKIILNVIKCLYNEMTTLNIFFNNRRSK
jgi:hypothetical protein